MIRAWAWAADRHLPKQHAKKLRKLVEVIPAKEPPDAGEPRIIFDVKLRTVGLVKLLKLGLDFLSVFSHRAELDAGKFAAAHGFALMREEHRPAVFDPDGQHDQRVNWQREEDRKNAED